MEPITARKLEANFREKTLFEKEYVATMYQVYGEKKISEENKIEFWDAAYSIYKKIKPTLSSNEKAKFVNYGDLLTKKNLYKLTKTKSYLIRINPGFRISIVENKKLTLMEVIEVLIGDRSTAVPCLLIADDKLQKQIHKFRHANRELIFTGIPIHLFCSKSISKYYFYLTNISLKSKRTVLLSPGQQERKQVKELLGDLKGEGIKEYIKKIAFNSCGINKEQIPESLEPGYDFATLMPFAAGYIGNTPATLHQLIFGPAGFGKSTIIQYLRFILNSFEEANIAKVSQAGLTSTTQNDNGHWVSFPGLLPRASGGVFATQDVHQLTRAKASWFYSTLSTVMETGKVTSSDAARCEYISEVSIHLDGNMTSDNYKENGIFSSEFSNIPANFLSRLDCIMDIPSDIQYDFSKIAQDLSKPSYTKTDAAKEQRIVLLLISRLVDLNYEVSHEFISGYMETKIKEYLSELKESNIHKYFIKDRNRVHKSIQKIINASARSCNRYVANEQDFDVALSFVKRKIAFVARYQNEVGSQDKTESDTDFIRDKISEQFSGQTVAMKQLLDFLTPFFPQERHESIRTLLKRVLKKWHTNRKRGLWTITKKGTLEQWNTEIGDW